MIFKKLLIFSLATSSIAFGEICQFQKSCSKGVLPIYIAPEIYHVHRTRQGGSEQGGMVYGVRAGYDRVKRSKLYVGFDALYGSGVLEGKGSSGNCIKSNFSDLSLEGRFGYTFSTKYICGFLFTPYVGLGYFVEKNNFTEPRVLPIHFRISYLFGSAGFLSNMRLTEKFAVGINFKVRFPYDAKCRVSHDPRGPDTAQVFGEKIQYRVELPMTYRPCEDTSKLFFSFVPFYELRQYGYQANYPHDFLNTRLNIYGAQFKILYLL